MISKFNKLRIQIILYFEWVKKITHILDEGGDWGFFLKNVFPNGCVPLDQEWLPNFVRI
jgi:hypothetical protein